VKQVAAEKGKALHAGFLSRLFWSLGNFGASSGLRFASNLVLTRLLAPEIFGVMVVLNVIRFGFELLTDVGIEQNIVRHKEGLQPRFFNTAWTMQIIRGTWLTLVFLLAARPLASFYHIEPALFAAMAFAPFLNGLHSTAIFGLVKTLDVRRRTLFELKAEGLGFIVTIGLAMVHPTAWAVVSGMLITIAARSAMSYRLPRPAHFLVLDRGHCRDILLFGRWIMVSSIIMFAAMSLDKLVLGRVAPLAVLGIFGLARTVAELPTQLGQRLTHQLIFPLLSAARVAEDTDAIHRIGSARLRLVLLMAVGIGVGVASADWAVAILYDPRYAQAGWMLSLLLVGSFVSTLSSFSEGVLLGSNRPAFLSGANVLRVVILAAGLWAGYVWLGIVGMIAAIIASELGRYAFLSFGQRTIGFSFGRQDALAAVVMMAVAGGLIALRLAFDLSTPLTLMPELDRPASHTSESGLRGILPAV
jgi:O-antigen/teichoic acid export membrane protein